MTALTGDSFKKRIFIAIDKAFRLYRSWALSNSHLQPYSIPFYLPSITQKGEQDQFNSFHSEHTCMYLEVNIIFPLICGGILPTFKLGPLNNAGPS